MTKETGSSFWPNRSSAQEALHHSLAAEKLYGRFGLSADRKAAVIARNVLHEELGYYSDVQQDYSLDDATRDRLLAHSRQDSAHALILAIEVHRLLHRIGWLLIAILFALAYMIWRMGV